MSSYKRLTIKELRAYSGCENYTDEQAEEIIKGLETLSILCYEIYQKELSERNGNLEKQL